jgi:glycogen debranching enzyme
MGVEPVSATDVIEIGQQFYIRARSSLADARILSLLHGDTLVIFNRNGDIQPVGLGQQGIFFQDTRHLSRLELQIAGMRPLLLSSSIHQDNVLLSVDLTNPDLELPSGQPLPRGTLHLHRDKLLTDAACLERIIARNYSGHTVQVELTIAYAADFVDMFEVRGQKRSRRGMTLPEESGSASTTLAYEGLDQVLRRTRLDCSLASCRFGAGELSVPLQLKPHEELVFSLDTVCESDGEKQLPSRYDETLRRVTTERHASPLAGLRIDTSNEQFNDWVNRSVADLQMLLVATPQGLYPYAGVPWFCCVFGRDGIITALQLLWAAPEIARGVLGFLAATQATSVDPERDAEPGKILHELRKGEMARLREVPFDRYYGSVDATPLFLVLAAAYYERTADLAFLKKIWPNMQKALEWIDAAGDADGDGFVEYSRQATTGLLQQGWKDSQDSVFHSDGSLAHGPIALCEVQSYVYAARMGVTAIAAALGHTSIAEAQRLKASQLRNRFDASFWCDDLSTFAIALDGEKRPCRVRSSNAGHTLFSGLALSARRQSLIKDLLSPGLFSGWGVRTIAAEEKRYNPMSYHNGSVWPHDNSLIAYGALNSRHKELPLQILSALTDQSKSLELHRLPELICGFPRRPGKAPTLYPVACSPQAWAAGACFLVLQSCLGLSLHAGESRIYLRHTALPESLSSVEIHNLRVGSASVDLAFERRAHTVSIDILRRSGEVEIVALR